MFALGARSKTSIILIMFHRWSDIKWATEELFVNEEFREGMGLNFKDIANVEEFYEWLDGCKCNYVYEKDDYGLINITFFPTEIEETEDGD